MAIVKAIVRGKPFSGSEKSHSNYDRTVSCNEFNVQRIGTRLRVFFPINNGAQGVGLDLPSPQVAIALGRALLTVGEGYSSEIEAHLLEG